MPDIYLLKLTLSGHVEKRGDGLWASYNNEFGFITYGKTRLDAIREAIGALDSILDVYRTVGGIQKLERWLTRKRVQYQLTKIPRTKPVARGSFAPKLARMGQVQKYRAVARRPLKLAA